jgi:hypothetical protein
VLSVYMICCVSTFALGLACSSELGSVPRRVNPLHPTPPHTITFFTQPNPCCHPCLSSITQSKPSTRHSPGQCSWATA